MAWSDKGLESLSDSMNGENKKTSTYKIETPKIVGWAYRYGQVTVHWPSNKKVPNRFQRWLTSVCFGLEWMHQTK